MDKISEAKEIQQSSSQQSYTMLTMQKWSEKYWDLSNTKPAAFWYTDMLSQCTYWIVKDISLSMQVSQRIAPFQSWTGLIAKLKCSILMLTFTFQVSTLFEKAVNPIPPLSSCQHAVSCSAIQNLICKKKNQ